MTDRSKPPPFSLPHVAKNSRGGFRRSGAGLGLLVGGASALTCFSNGWIWLSAVGILAMIVATGAWWRTRADEPTTAFEIREESLLVEGVARPFTSIAAARWTSSADGILTARRTSLWLEFDDGSTLGIGHWITNSAAIQAAIIERLPDGLRAHLDTASRLTA